MRARRKDYGRAMTHGDTVLGVVHPIYRAYRHMIERCYKPNTKQFHNYGGAGVTVCDEWRNDYLAFKKWSIENGWKKGLEIDKDILSSGDKIYSPSTCMWVTHAENCKHRIAPVGATKIKGITQDKRKIPNKSFFGQKTIKGKKYSTTYFNTAQEAKIALDILIKMEK